MKSVSPTVGHSRRRALLAGAALGLTAGSRVLHAAPQPFTIRFSHVVAEDTPKGLAALRFRALVQDRSGGRIAVAVHPEGQLYGDHDEMQALQLGAVEILAPSLSKFGRIGFPEFELFDLPFFFPDVASVRRITQGALGRRMLERLAHQRLVGLGFMDNGFKHMSANRPLLEPQAFVGQRMRIQASRVIAAQMRALGAQPVTLAFSETREALAVRVVDGTENPVSNFWTQGMHEVQTDLSLTEHGYLGYAVVASERFWSALPTHDRTLVAGAMREALVFGNQIADTQNDKALQALRQSDTTRIHVPSAAQFSLMRAAVVPVHAALAQRIGPQWPGAAVVPHAAPCPETSRDRELVLAAFCHAFGNDANAHARVDQSAHGVEAVDLNAQLQRQPQLMGDLVQKFVQRAARVHTHVVVLQGVGERQLAQR